jgi:uncharacterized protein
LKEYQVDLLVSPSLSDPSIFDRAGLLKAILAQFRINRDGAHGTKHWARVRKHALTVGQATGADLLVVELFSFLHDSQRENEYQDAGHGHRAADYARSLRAVYFDLTPTQLDKLCLAMIGHSDGQVHTDSTVQTCWDADRLDLGRVGKKPHSRYLSVEAAKHIESAYEWSQR